MKTKTTKNEKEMKYEVNLFLLEFDEGGFVKFNESKFYFPFDSQNNILDARHKAISKAKELDLILIQDESFDHPLIAMQKNYKSTKGFQMGITLKYGDRYFQIYGFDEPLGELSGEADFFLSLGLDCDILEIKCNGFEGNILQEDFDFTLIPLLLDSEVEIVRKVKN